MPIGERVSGLTPHLLSVLRIVVALLFIEHGSVKLLGFPPSAEFANVPLFSLEGLSGVLELLGGLMLLPGLLTRLVAFMLSGEMAVAYFIAHAPKSFFPAVNKGELAVVYAFVFLFLAAAGPGPWSLDQRLSSRPTGRGVSTPTFAKEKTARSLSPWQDAA
jgi:putative oxidoreductase